MESKKFKAWNTSQNKMYYPTDLEKSQTRLSSNGSGFVSTNKIRTKPIIQHNHLIPLQYLGHQDSKRQDIYEGDIVNCYLENGTSTPSSKVVTAALDSETFGLFENSVALVILGNTYENPEMVGFKKVNAII